jgi:hypothetical protein
MEKKAMTQKTRTTLKKWMDFQLASVEATKLLETGRPRRLRQRGDLRGHETL